MDFESQPIKNVKACRTVRRRLYGLFMAMSTVALSLGSPASAQTPVPGLTTGVVFTADEYGSTISQIDLSSGKVTTVPATIEPHNIQISPDGSLLLAVGLKPDPAEKPADQSSGGAMANMEGMDVPGELVLFDPHNIAAGPVARIAVGKHPAHVITDLAGKRAFVTNAEDDTLSVIDLASREVIATVATDDYPHGQRLSPDGRQIMVANVQSGTVSVIDTETLKKVGSISVGLTPVQVAFTPDESRLYVSLRDANQVAVVDVKTKELIATVDVGRNPIQVFATPDGRFVYVANQGTETDPDNRVSVIAVATNTVVATIETGRGAHGVVVGPDGATVFVTNILDATVSAIEVETQTVIATIPVGRGPNGITFLP